MCLLFSITAIFTLSVATVNAFACDGTGMGTSNTGTRCVCTHTGTVYACLVLEMISPTTTAILMEIRRFNHDLGVGKGSVGLSLGIAKL